MERDRQRKIVEALILASPEPLSAARLADIVPRLTPAKAKKLVSELRDEYTKLDLGFEIWEVAGGYQLRTLPEYAAYVKQLQRERALRLSRAALETLAVIAYKQPVTRAEVEHIRGVDVGAVMRGLVERRLVRIAGHREVPGRPMLYGTSKRFLEVFGLNRLEDLPTLRDLKELAPPDLLLEGDGGQAAGAPVEAETEEAPPPPSELH